MEELNRKILHSNIIYTFVFGVLWGLLEIFANTFLVPNNIFLKGLIFSCIVVIVLITAKKIIDYKFSLLLVSIISLLIIFAGRGFSVNIMIALFSEAFIAEVIFLRLKFKLAAAMTTGALIFLYSFIHGLICHGSLPYSYIVYQYNNLFYEFTGAHVSKDVYFLVQLFFGFISLIIGIGAGWLIYIIINTFEDRLKKFVY